MIKVQTITRLLARMTPIQFLVLGYVVLIFLGSLLLRLPAASNEGSPQQYIDAVFTTTSAVSTTGLTVVDTGSYYSFFGQVVILILFQIGGLGYMTFAVLMVYTLGGKPSLTSAVTLKESLSGVTLGNMKKYLKSIFVFTALFEGCGALILTVYWLREFSLSRSVYLGVFHSVSAFCTCGFSVFPDSFTTYQTSGVITVVISTLSMAGGIGFIVLYDVQQAITRKISHQQPRQLMLHTKLCILFSTLLIMTGSVVIFAFEGQYSFSENLLTSVFQSISASSTTGFHTVDIRAFSSTTLLTIIVLMFIGASPGGSGGGIKVTAFGSMVLSIREFLRGKREVDSFNRKIPTAVVQGSFIVGLMVLLWVVLVTIVLTATEEAAFLSILFEVVSAVGTVGLSTGITGGLTVVGKLLIIVTMLTGRVGPLALALSVVGEPKPVRVKYAEGEVYIG